MGLGAGIVLVHAGVRFALRCRADGEDETVAFVRCELASIAGRMALVLVLTAAVLLYVPVPPVPFVAALMGGLLLSVAWEVGSTARRLRTPPNA